MENKEPELKKKAALLGVKTRTQDTRGELMEAALHCFSRHGFDGTSIRMIAQKAARPLSLIGHHFGSKDGLYLEVFRFLMERSCFAVSHAGVSPKDKAEAIQLFRAQIHALYLEACSEDLSKDPLRLAGRRLLLLEMRDPRPEILELIQKRFQPWVEQVRACLQVLRPDLKDEDVAFYGRVIMSQVSSEGLMEGVSSAIWGQKSYSAYQRAELLVAFSLRGLGVAPECIGI